MKLFNPVVIAILLLHLAALLAIAGIYLLVGLGWALIAGAIPLALLAFIIFRGINRAAQQIAG